MQKVRHHLTDSMAYDKNKVVAMAVMNSYRKEIKNVRKKNEV